MEFKYQLGQLVYLPYEQIPLLIVKRSFVQYEDREYISYEVKLPNGAHTERKEEDFFTQKWEYFFKAAVIEDDQD